MIFISFFFHYLFKNKDIERNKELLRASSVVHGTEKIKKFMTLIADPNMEVNKKGMTFLHLAGSADLVTELISHGANVNKENNDKLTPLFIAVSEGKDLEVVRALIHGGANIDFRTHNNETLLHFACKVAVVNELISLGLEVNAQDRDGCTPLHTAAKNNKEPLLVKALLSAGSDANVKSLKEKVTPLHWSSNAEVTRELLTSGANINAKDRFGLSPLHIAVVEKKYTVVHELLKHGANVNLVDFKDNTALSYAFNSEEFDNKVIQELLENKASICIGGFHSSLLKALHYNLPCAKFLLKYSLLVNADALLEPVYKNIAHFDHIYPYVESKLPNFLDRCLSEIVLMKNEIFTSNQSVYDLAKKRIVIVKPIYTDEENFKKQILIKYPMYHDVIWPQINLRFERAKLLNKLKQLQVYTSTFDTKLFRHKYVTLDCDCVGYIGEKLSNVDLNNFVNAFDTGGTGFSNEVI